MPKTILISMFSNVARGNFENPGGVLELFRERAAREDCKIIYLTHKAYTHKLNLYLDKNIFVEIGPDYLPSGFLKNLFRFFYSFLIFTGTTRILATFGAKADRPPAGGNRHLAPLKSFVANTFGRSNFIKKTFVPRLFPKIFNDRPYKNLFDKYAFDLVFLPNAALFPDLEVLNEAKRRGIKTIGMACNWDHLNKYFIPLQADYLLVQNEPMMQEAVILQAYKKDKVFPVGFSQFDSYVHFLKNPMRKKEFFEKFGIPTGSKLILFVSGAAYSLDESDIVRTISTWISEGKFGRGVKLMLRPYVITRDIEQEQEKYKEFLADKNIVFNWLRRDKSMENRNYYTAMLAYADVIIPIFSTIAIEAAILDRPTVTIGFDGYKVRPFHQSIRRLETMSHFKHVLDTGSVRVARSFPDLSGSIREYLANPSKDRERRRELVEKMCFKMDGEASQRIADFIFQCCKI